MKIVCIIKLLHTGGKPLLFYLITLKILILRDFNVSEKFIKTKQQYCPSNILQINTTQIIIHFFHVFVNGFFGYNLIKIY